MTGIVPRPAKCEEHGVSLGSCGPCASLPGTAERLDEWAHELSTASLQVALTCLLGNSQVYTLAEYNALLRQAIKRLGGHR